MGYGTMTRTLRCPASTSYAVTPRARAGTRPPIRLDDRPAMAGEPEAIDAAATIARLLGVDVARAHLLLDDYGALAPLARADRVELRARHRLTERQATRLQDALRLGPLLLLEDAGPRPRIASPDDVARLMRPHIAGLPHEEVWVLLLDMRCHCIAPVRLYVGTADTCVVQIAEIFRVAIRRNAPRLILVHNHPTGDPSPSDADIRLTRDAVRAGELLDITVLDHVIIGTGDHASLSARGLCREAVDASNVTLE